jgi:Fe-S cluster assembly iron-binding protein IscA
MFQVSEKASELIKQFLQGQQGTQSIRLLMTEGGWRGAYLVMALDEQKENDQFLLRKA